MPMEKTTQQHRRRINKIGIEVGPGRGRKHKQRFAEA